MGIKHKKALHYWERINRQLDERGGILHVTSEDGNAEDS